MWQGWVTLGIGLWLFFGEWLLKANFGSKPTDYMWLGIFAFVFGLWAFFQTSKTLTKIWFLIILIGGLWLGLCAYIPSLQGVVNEIVVGAVFAILGFWTAIEKANVAAEETPTN